MTTQHIRRLVRSIIKEIYSANSVSGWHDPNVLFVDESDDDIEDHDERKNYSIMLKVKNNGYDDANSKLGAIKPTMPAGSGGSQSNRMPGGKVVAPSRAYSPGH